MFKVCILLAVAVACVTAQEAADGQNAAAPEPYSYGYQTDTHAASEQRDQQGKVTGFYTIVDADGRERRVEYTADESGFHAKVATNEIGTRSSNPADVEILASEPTPGQYAVYQQSPQQQVQTTTFQQASAPVVRQQSYVLQQQQQPSRFTTTTVTTAPAAKYVQSQAYPGYGNQLAYGTGYNTAYTTGAYYPGYTYGYGANNQAAGYGVGYQGLQVGNYNNHLPSQYYRSISSTTTSGAPGVYGQAVQGGVRYVNQPAAGVRSVGYGAVNYGAPASTTTTTTRSSSQGSSNYLVLQKRAANENN